MTKKALELLQLMLFVFLYKLAFFKFLKSATKSVIIKAPFFFYKWQWKSMS